MGWLEDLKDHLEGALTLGSPVFFETFDNKAPDCICIIHQSGPGNKHVSGIKTLKRAEIGIRIRNQDEATAEQQAETLSDYLELKTSFWAGNTWFKRISNDSGFYHVSTDNVNGTIYSLNCYVEFEE